MPSIKQNKSHKEIIIGAIYCIDREKEMGGGERERESLTSRDRRLIDLQGKNIVIDAFSR